MGVFLPLDTLDHEGMVLELVVELIHVTLLTCEDKFFFIWYFTLNSVIATVLVILYYLRINFSLFICIDSSCRWICNICSSLSHKIWILYHYSSKTIESNIMLTTIATQVSRLLHLLSRLGRSIIMTFVHT
jgi:hypothetical protein